VTARVSLFALAFAAGCAARASSSPEATGTLELVEVDVAPLVPARVTKVWRDEGDRVRAGDTLLTLTQSTLASNIAGQQAAVQAAEAQLRDLQAGARPSQVARAESELAAAQAEAQRAAEDLARITPLAERGVASKQQLDAARAAAKSAEGRRDALRDSARLVKEGARPQQIAAARASLASARAALSGAQQTATDLVLTAPMAGTVLSRNAEPGEVLAAGTPGVTIADPTRPYVRIYVDQVKFPSIRVGDTVGVFLDAFPERRFRGVVSAVSDRAEFTPRVALTRDERADLMYGVKVQLVDTSNTLKAGLPVTVHLPQRTSK
jgi:HlyD family secretion protein